MEQEVLPRPEVVALLRRVRHRPALHRLRPDQVDPPGRPAQLADENIDLEAKLFDDVTNPNYVVLDGDGNVLGKLGGKVSPDVFAGFLKGALDRHKEAARWPSPDRALIPRPNARIPAVDIPQVMYAAGRIAQASRPRSSPPDSANADCTPRSTRSHSGRRPN